MCYWYWCIWTGNFILGQLYQLGQYIRSMHSQSYIGSMKSWLQDYGIRNLFDTHWRKVCSQGNLSSNFQKKLKNICLQYPNNVYVHKAVNIVVKYHNTYFMTAKMKPTDVKTSTYIHYYNENYNDFCIVIILIFVIM